MKKIIFFIVCFLFITSNVWAISIECPNISSPGEEINVKVRDDSYNGIKAKYKFDSNFLYQDMTLNKSWRSYYDGVDGFSIGNVINSDDLDMDISLKVKMNASLDEEYVLSLSDIDVNDSSDKTVRLDDISCNIKLVSDINTLDSLVIDGVSLSPKFDKNVLSYKATTKSERIVIKAKVSDSSSKIEGDLGEKKLNIGVNNFVVKVTSARGNVREYKIYITRTIDKKSSDVTLKSLKISNAKIDFKKDVFLYQVNVSNEVESIDIEAVANDKKALVNIDKPDKLVVGENNIKVIVTAEDGTKGVYEIVVNRMHKLSSDASVKNLIIKNYDINFSSDVFNYELEIDNEDSLDIDVILNNDKATYNIEGNRNLIDGSIIKIVVTAEDGNINNYNLKIRKPSQNNSNSIFDYIGIVPVILFVSLVLLVLIIKIIKSKFLKSK